MEKYVRYMGEFLSRGGVIWRAEILQEADGPFASVGALTFEGSEPLVIEWPDTAKHEPICSSSATLRIESPADRTYEDLYSIAPGRVRLDVYRNGLLYWSGLLDPEFYEEPYERADKYPVSLTFSDFGILKRLKYNLEGVRTLEEILEHALAQSGIKYNGVDFSSYQSTDFGDGNGGVADLAALGLRSENFFDEEGEASTLEEVLKGMLQPLGLRIIQRNGMIWVYDLNGLYKKAEVARVEWSGDSSTLSTDSVYNKVTITFSPYADETLLTDELTYTDEHSPDLVNYSNYAGDELRPYYSFASSYGRYDKPSGIQGDWSNIHFTLFLSEEGEGVAEISPEARYCYVEPMVNGPEEATAIAWLFTVGHGALSDSKNAPYKKLNAEIYADRPAPNQLLMKSRRVFLPRLDPVTCGHYFLRLNLEMLLDVRYNPFTEADDDNEKSNYNTAKSHGNWAFVPTRITLYDSEGNALYHYRNRQRTASGCQGDFLHSLRMSEWHSGEPIGTDSYCWLAYYDSSDPKKGTGILDWQCNRQNIGRPDIAARRTLAGFSDGNMEFRMYESFKAMDDGEYIPYPPAGGYLEVEVFAGVCCYDWGEAAGFGTESYWTKNKLYDKVRWLMYKAPKIDIVKNNLRFDSAELDDVEYTGELNADAREELSIDTICGYPKSSSPTARGAYLKAPLFFQAPVLEREGVTACAEQLFIGTLYSQYANRMTALSGECLIDPDGLRIYSEDNQPPAKRFMILGETQDVITDCTEVKLVELRGDEYKPKR